MVNIGDKIKIEGIVTEYDENKNIVKLNLKINGEKENGEKMDDVEIQFLVDKLIKPSTIPTAMYDSDLSGLLEKYKNS